MPSWNARYLTNTPEAVQVFLREAELFRRDQGCTDFTANEDPQHPGCIDIQVTFSSPPNAASWRALRRVGAEAEPATPAPFERYGEIIQPRRVVSPEEALLQVRETQADHRRYQRQIERASCIERLFQDGKVSLATARELGFASLPSSNDIVDAFRIALPLHVDPNSGFATSDLSPGPWTMTEEDGGVAINPAAYAALFGQLHQQMPLPILEDNLLSSIQAAEDQRIFDLLDSAAASEQIRNVPLPPEEPPPEVIVRRSRFERLDDDF